MLCFIGLVKRIMKWGVIESCGFKHNMFFIWLTFSNWFSLMNDIYVNSWSKKGNTKQPKPKDWGWLLMLANDKRCFTIVVLFKWFVNIWFMFYLRTISRVFISFLKSLRSLWIITCDYFVASVQWWILWINVPSIYANIESCWFAMD